MTEKKAVENGSEVTIEYTGRLDDGTTFDTTAGRDPFTFVAGEGKVIKGFDDAVAGMKAGEEKKVDIPSAEAYGQRDEQLVRDVSKSAFPGQMELKEGATLQLRSPEGQMLLAKIVSIGEEQVKLDLNHPLAGKNLHFDIRVVDVK